MLQAGPTNPRSLADGAAAAVLGRPECRKQRWTMFRAPPPTPYRLIVCVCGGGGVNTDATSPPVPQHTPTRDRFRRGGGSLSRTRGVYPDSREVGAMQPSPRVRADATAHVIAQSTTPRSTTSRSALGWQNAGVRPGQEGKATQPNPSPRQDAPPSRSTQTARGEGKKSPQPPLLNTAGGVMASDDGDDDGG